MKGEIRYIWEDEDGVESISRTAPINACLSMMGGQYTPSYRMVVIIEVEETSL